MKLSKILLFFILICFESKAQNFSIKKQIPSLSTVFLAGFSEGFTESIQFQYKDFKRVFPKANDKFWDPQISWKNKYKNNDYTQGRKFFGSTTFLVWTTDGYHMTRFFRNTMFVTTITLRSNKKRNWKSYAFDIVTHTVAYHLGFFTSYDAMFGGIKKW